MKNYLRYLLQNKEVVKLLSLLLVIILGTLIRFYKFPQRINYGPEQAMSLIVSGNYIREKPSLLGQRYFRETSKGYTLFSGAIFNYSLVPLEYIFNHNIVPITAYFTILNILTGVILYFIVRKLINAKVAFFATLVFLFDPIMINHSLFLWNYNYLPLIFLVSLHLLYLFFSKKKIKYIFLLGILAGVGVSIQLLYIFPLFLLLVSVVFTERKLSHFITFIAGSIIGNLPMVLFDLRHDFYHIKTAYVYFYETILTGRGGGVMYYHILYLWIIFAIVGGYVLYLIFNKNIYLGYITIFSYIYLSITSPYVNLQKAIGMPEGLAAVDVYSAAQIIATDSESCGSFNVIEVIDFDTRAHVLRYPLIFKYGKTPLGYINYKEVECVYSLSEEKYNYNEADFWEINEIKPFSVEKIASLNKNYAVFKLTHD
ncbi:MAG: hypothetical protein US60_C0011G0013 [Microgenomates group bacterium GW2011_GWC1_37_8]|uniref:Glycosyltransferase RgtA/B/C/D-like domain-containing protein n=1 Tax=Candidatus Woesebacteria bacterium GW2011_GWB1_38_8 TaxID=1618570 RepID=A0A0G0NJT2_9BACT|nr:MAG: hypothetical protein US60_C0011G0013 [Microgenomates group bacterium GW2011_GWC1_37_8]KKQ86139.1 MAG: hypothetical protein UT08_C0001G0005 [Candidatus Woesebacteria bacterium GW2011_GWB1_38_8]